MSDTSVVTLVIERDPESGWYIGCIAELPGCYTQAPTIEELRANMKEALACYLDVCDDQGPGPEFIGIEKIEVPR